MKKYGIFGGTFNPPHIAHSIVAESVRQQLNLDKIIFVPSANHPFKKSIPAEHRLAMSRLAFGDDKNFEVNDVEFKNIRKKSYTVNTLQILTDFYGDADLFLIIGVDNLIELPKWKDPGKLFELAKVIVINRPNFLLGNANPDYSAMATFIDVPFLEISSSDIRDKVMHDKSIRYLVEPRVEEYISQHSLYKSI